VGRLSLLEYECASVEERHSAHLDHVIEVIVIEVLVKRDSINLNVT